MGDSECLSDAHVPDALRQMAGEAWCGQQPASFFERAKTVLHDKSPQMKQALSRASAGIIVWMHDGGTWRALLVTVVGLVVALGLAGLGTFMVFFLAATVNTVIISLLASIASIGAFMALFFTLLTAIYIGALVLAAITMSTITFFSICAAVVAGGWVVFLWLVWQGLKKAREVFQRLVFPPAAVFRAADVNGLKTIK